MRRQQEHKADYPKDSVPTGGVPSDVREGGQGGMPSRRQPNLRMTLAIGYPHGRQVDPAAHGRPFPLVPMASQRLSIAHWRCSRNFIAQSAIHTTHRRSRQSMSTRASTSLRRLCSACADDFPCSITSCTQSAVPRRCPWSSCGCVAAGNDRRLRRPLHRRIIHSSGVPNQVHPRATAPWGHKLGIAPQVLQQVSPNPQRPEWAP